MFGDLRVPAYLAWLLLAGCPSTHGPPDAVVDAGLDARADAATDSDTGPAPDAGLTPPCSAPEDCAVQEVVGGLAHTCARFASGRVACWGDNAWGQLGREGLERSTMPLLVPALPQVDHLVPGYIYTCARRGAEDLFCWGDGREQLLGHGAVATDWVPRGLEVTDLASGVAHTCVVTSAGAVRCWGVRNDDGALGIGSRDVYLEPVSVPGLAGVVEIAAGAFHTCARTSDGDLHCWGCNRAGEIGDGTGGTDDPATDALFPVLVLRGTSRVVASIHMTCALRESGEVLCWGDNVGGSLGTGSFERAIPSPTVVAMAAGTEVVDVVSAQGGGHTCALTSAGRVLCWGAGSSGQLGYGEPASSARLPVEAGGIDDAVAVAAGYAHTCAIRAGGALWCWGANEEGQLGDGTTENRYLPVPVLGLR